MSNVNSRCKSKIRILNFEHKSGNSERNRPNKDVNAYEIELRKVIKKYEIAKIYEMWNKKIIKRAKEGTLLS